MSSVQKLTMRHTGSFGLASSRQSGKGCPPLRVVLQQLMTPSLIVCLIMCDAFYSHSFSMYPVVRPESMHYYLPSETEAFEAATAKRWRRSVGADRSLSTHLFTFRRGGATIPLPLSAFGMHALLATIWVRESELRQRCLTSKSTADGIDVFESCQFQPDDPDLKDVGVLLLDLYSTLGSSIKSANPNVFVSWNNLCMALTADHHLFEIAAGRAGPKHARLALEKIGTWFQTPGARRACLHAAQTFAVMSQRRSSDGTTFHSEMALFASALVLGLFVSTSPARSVQANDTNMSDGDEPFELLDDVDWTTVGAEGLPFTLTGEHTADPADMSRGVECAARSFIRYGNSISFGGKIHLGGYDAARRIFLEYVGLLEDVGRWNVRRYCHILRLLSDMVMDHSFTDT